MSHTPNNISINVLYEDPQIIVCVKPPGIATQSRSLAAPDMVRLLKKHLYTGRPAGEPYLAVIHRLDQPVSGILVFAKTPAAARELNRQLQASDSQSFGKYYRALTAKKPPHFQRRLIAEKWCHLFFFGSVPPSSTVFINSSIDDTP